MSEFKTYDTWLEAPYQTEREYHEDNDDRLYEEQRDREVMEELK